MKSLVSLALRLVLRLLRVLVPRLAPLLARGRRRRGKLRSLWGVTPILTLPLLARADRLLGIRAETLVYVTYYISKNFDWNLSRVHKWVVQRIPQRYPDFCEVVFLLALLRYDIFHYFYDRGLMAPDRRYGIAARELQYLKEFGKQLYTYAYGADVRERTSTLALGRWNFCAECDDPGKYCICHEGERAASMAPLLPVASAMVAMGDMLTYVPKPYHLNYWPIDVDRFEQATPRRRQPRTRLVVAHAPNHSHFKGSKYLLAAIARLQAEGMQIELKEISGVANEEVLRLFAGADVVVDQLVGGFYGYTALEAMAVGRPVITSVRSTDLLLPGFPLLNATPDTIEQLLRDVYDGRHDLDALGAQGQRYVHEQQSIEAVSRRLASMYRATDEKNAALRGAVAC